MPSKCVSELSNALSSLVSLTGFCCVYNRIFHMLDMFRPTCFPTTTTLECFLVLMLLWIFILVFALPTILLTCSLFALAWLVFACYVIHWSCIIIAYFLTGLLDISDALQICTAFLKLWSFSRNSLFLTESDIMPQRILSRIRLSRRSPNSHVEFLLRISVKKAISFIWSLTTGKELKTFVDNVVLRITVGFKQVYNWF